MTSAIVRQRLTIRRTFIFLVFVCLFAFATRTASDPDLWWHLRTGQLIVETGAVPKADPFSYSQLGQTWISHEWLADLAIFGIYRVLHTTGLIVLFAAIAALGFLFLYLRCDGKPRVAAACVVLGAFACSPVLGARPQMFSFLLASFLLWLIDRSSDYPKRLLWIPLIFLVWVNLHAGFALGLAILLVFAIDSSLCIETRRSLENLSGFRRKSGCGRGESEWISDVFLSLGSVAIRGNATANRGVVLAKFSPARLLPAHAADSRCPDHHGFRHTQAEVAGFCAPCVRVIRYPDIRTPHPHFRPCHGTGIVPISHAPAFATIFNSTANPIRLCTNQGWS